MKMSSALARLGHEVVLVAKRAQDSTSADPYEAYQVPRNFTVESRWRPARAGGGALYVAGMAASLARRRRWADVVYCRDPVGALLAVATGMRVIFEAHEVPTTPWVRAAIAKTMRSPRTIGVVSISEALRSDLRRYSLAGDDTKIVVAPDACDPPSTQVRRSALRSPPVIGYVGSLYEGRGIDLIVALARELPGCRFRLVGGSDADVARWSAVAPSNVELLGFRSQAELPPLYAGFDIVLMPHALTGVKGATGREDISRWTSPMKMFEYMASGVPLIASPLPVLREVLVADRNAIIADSNDVESWRAAVERLLNDDDLRFAVAQRAQSDLASRYTWDARARIVLDELDLVS